MGQLRRPGPAGLLLAALALMGTAPAAARADLILSDNLPATSGGTEAATGDTWLAASFATDASGYDLSSVTLLLQRSSIGGQAELDIYTDGGLEPGSLVGTLTAPAGIGTSLAEVTFTASGIALDANSTYWVVLKAPGGAFDWSWTADNTGSGPGFLVAWSESDDAGGTWFTADNFPFQMRVSANPVPEPTSIALLGAGAAGVIVYLRRRPRGPAGREPSEAVARPNSEHR